MVVTHKLFLIGKSIIVTSVTSVKMLVWIVSKAIARVFDLPIQPVKHPLMLAVAG